MARWHSCNVLQTDKAARRLWQFNTGGDKFNIKGEETRLPGEPLPEKTVAKDWPTLFQPKLNIAWLPPEEVFLRVVQLPKSNFAETQSMLDLQLEKVSPLPVAQIVWTFEILPEASGEMQTAVVVIASRQHVESFLGQLEADGYMADRLELPLIDQLRATEINGDGVWIYPGLGADNYTCLIAWWYGGTLCNLTLLKLPAGERQPQLMREHLTQMAWAGEIEGWLTTPPRYHIVADAETAATWSKGFSEDEPLMVVPPLPAQNLAALTARRAATEEKRASLLPTEFTSRYRQQLIDRLWMRALFAMLVLYVFGVAVYLGLAQVARWQYNKVNDEMALLGPTFTNTVKLKEEVKVLQDQVNLQFAGLECWKAVADNLPSELTLESLGFESGRRLTVRGTCPSSNITPVYDFIESLREATTRDQKIFASVSPGRISAQANGVSGWVINAELKQTEQQ